MAKSLTAKWVGELEKSNDKKILLKIRLQKKLNGKKKLDEIKVDAKKSRSTNLSEDDKVWWQVFTEKTIDEKNIE